MLVHEPTQSLALHVPDPEELQYKFARSRVLHTDKYNLQVPHTLSTVATLRQLGYNPPSPIEYHYNWPGKYKPFAHQKTMAAFLTMHHRAFNLSEMGVGKSAAALWATDYMMSQDIINRVLILTSVDPSSRVGL